MDIIVPKPKKNIKEKPVKKEIGEYFDFPCRQCDKKMVKKYVYGYIEDPSRLSRRLIPGGCCIHPDSPKWKCENCGLESGHGNY